MVPRTLSGRVRRVLHFGSAPAELPGAGLYKAGPMLRCLDGRRRLASKHIRASWVIVWNSPAYMVAGACFGATKTHVVCFSGDRVRQATTIPRACGNGHLLTPDNLRIDEAEGRWRCRR